MESVAAEPTLSRDELAALLAINRAIGRHLHRDVLFGSLAGCLRTIVPTERFGIELPIEGGRLQGHLLTPVQGREEPTQPTVLDGQGTVCDAVLRSRTWSIFATRDALRDRYPVTFEIMQRESMQALLALPLETGDRCRGVLFFMSAQCGAYDRLPRALLAQVASAVAVALDDCLAHEELRTLRDRLAAENVYLREEIRDRHATGALLGESPAMRRVVEWIEQVAPTPATVLVLGETGVGKELVARAIHERSARADRPLVKVNCAAISAGLVESELFGHARGSFTGASGDRIGRFELADGGTLFLDEIGELPLDTQGKLLRVLQEQEFEPVGSSKTRRVDVRFIAATNRDLAREVAEGRFRADLFYRLNVLPIHIPPLRERREDVPLLARSLCQRFARELGKRIDDISDASMRRLDDYAWPGNVRELANVIQRAAVLATTPILEIGAELPAAAPAGEPASAASPATLESFEREHIRAALEYANWVIEGTEGAAHALGLHPSTLRSRIRRFGLTRPAPPGAD